MPAADQPFVLASASPRRAELLAAAGYTFTVEAADIDETPHTEEAPDVYVLRMAATKARVVAERRPGMIVLGADTTVVAAGDILGKPRDSHDAVSMLARLQGRAHQVLTGVAITDGRRRLQAVAATDVWFAPMTVEEIGAYVASGEPMDKAGAYGIQGRAARYVTRIAGSYDNVVGLPIAVVHELFSRWATLARPADIG